MSRIGLITVAALVLLGAGAWYLASYNGKKALTADEDAAVRTFVIEFGTKLNMVSLMAPAAERAAAMELYYGPYVAPELLAQWKPEGAEALGRTTSSPWPERIEVGTVQKTGVAAYVVEGNLIEVATAPANTTQVAAIHPLTFALERRSGKLLIVKLERGEPILLTPTATTSEQ